MSSVFIFVMPNPCKNIYVNNQYFMKYSWQGILSITPSLTPDFDRTSGLIYCHYHRSTIFKRSKFSLFFLFSILENWQKEIQLYLTCHIPLQRWMTLVVMSIFLMFVMPHPWKNITVNNQYFKKDSWQGILSQSPSHSPDFDCNCRLIFCYYLSKHCVQMKQVLIIFIILDSRKV